MKVIELPKGLSRELRVIQIPGVGPIQVRLGFWHYLWSGDPEV